MLPYTKLKMLVLTINTNITMMLFLKFVYMPTHTSLIGYLHYYRFVLPPCTIQYTMAGCHMSYEPLSRSEHAAVAVDNKLHMWGG